MVWRERCVHFEEAGVAEKVGAVISRELVELTGGEDLGFVVLLVVSSLERACAGLWDKNGSATQEIHNRWNVKDVLIVSREKEDAIGADGAADRTAELMLAVLRLEVEEGWLGPEHAVANEIKAGAVKVVRS
jgi:hypothetical protein